MVTMHAFGQMIQCDLRLERQGGALILRSKHNARWLRWSAASRSFFSSNCLACPIRVVLAYTFVIVIGVVFAGIGVFLAVRSPPLLTCAPTEWSTI
jgi:hypothetical protein